MKLDSAQIEEILGLIHDVAGRQRPGTQELVFKNDFLARIFHSHMQKCSVGNVDEYITLLKNAPSELDYLYDSLHINYSEFFRNSLTFAALEAIILPDLISRRKKNGSQEIRIWSSACADGKEAYSIAILLEELKQRFNADFTYRIFATDISQQHLTQAITGLFCRNAVEKMSLQRINRWFSRLEGNYAISEQLKRCIDFSVFDLLSDSKSCPASSIFGDFDLVFCANLLFYYDDEAQKNIIRKISKCIKPKGYLITGETERNNILKLGFQEAIAYSAIFGLNGRSIR